MITAAHCDKKCAEDTALNAAGDACEPIDGKDDICRVNNNVAQAKHFSFGQFSDWTDCSDAEEVHKNAANEQQGIQLNLLYCPNTYIHYYGKDNTYLNDQY